MWWGLEEVEEVVEEGGGGGRCGGGGIKRIGGGGGGWGGHYNSGFNFFGNCLSTFSLWLLIYHQNATPPSVMVIFNIVY